MVRGLPSVEDLNQRRAQMFPTLSAAQMDRIAAFGVETSFEAGAILFEQGDRNLSFYVVVDGELELVSPQGDREETVSVLKAREFSGETSILGDRQALVRGRARSRLRVIRIGHEQFKSLIQTDSELSELLMRAFILRRMGLLAAGLGDTAVIGSRHSSSTLRLQDFLARNGHPYRYLDVDRDPDVQAMLDRFHVEVNDIPVVICRGQLVLRNPTDAHLADCLGFNAARDPETVYDLAICGAGPGGLAAAVYGASEGLNVVLIEAHAPGGQAASSSKIENYLGFPTGISGQALAGRALIQAEKFGAQLVVARRALRLRCDRPAIRIDLSEGESLLARTVIIATGAEYRKLDVPGLSRFEGQGIYYAATYIELQACGDEPVIVVGGGNSAGQAATFLAQGARQILMLIRGSGLASSMSRYLIRRIEETPNVRLHRRARIVALDGAEHLEHVTWRDDERGEETACAIRHVFAMTGATPNTDWLRGSVSMDDKGFVHTGFDLTPDLLARESWPLARRPYLFETSCPHVFAIGDVRSSSLKRVASAVGEGSVCVQLIQRALSE